jgi:hypothetical protein
MRDFIIGLTARPLEFERAILRCKDISNQQMQKLEAERLKNINHNDFDNLQSNLSNNSKFQASQSVSTYIHNR